VKKLILAFITVAFIGLGGVPAHAQDDTGPVDCIDQPSSDPNSPCYNPVLYPPTTPATTGPTTTQATLPPLSPDIPKTGSGISPILSIGALLVLGGGMIVVAARRRSTATSPAT
jgi:LPXTG-motif cell wall-anchored protein